MTLFAAPTPPNLRNEDPLPPEGPAQAIWNFIERDDLNTLSTPLPEYDIAHIWRGARRLGDELLAACVEDQQRAGIVVGRLGNHIPGSWYLISIGTRGDISSVMDNRVAARAKASLQGVMLPAFEGQPAELFDQPSYQI